MGEPTKDALSHFIEQSEQDPKALFEEWKAKYEEARPEVPCVTAAPVLVFQVTCSDPEGQGCKNTIQFANVGGKIQYFPDLQGKQAGLAGMFGGFDGLTPVGKLIRAYLAERDVLLCDRCGAVMNWVMDEET